MTPPDALVHPAHASSVADPRHVPWAVSSGSHAGAVRCEPKTVPVDVPDLAELDSVRARLRPHLVRTPLIAAGRGARGSGTEILLKAENRQLTGSFKARGALAHVTALAANGSASGVVAASAGNHAQGVALAARLLAWPCDVFVPANAPAAKISGAESLGAVVHRAPGGLDSAFREARDFAAASGRDLVHPFDDRDVVLGQASVALEILKERPDVRTVVVPAAGGGLLAGTAVAVHAVAPWVSVVGVQPSGARALTRSLLAGELIGSCLVDTVADGLRVSRAGALPLRWCAALADRLITVSDEATETAMRRLAVEEGLIAEPAGAVGLAGAERLEGPVAVVVSGGNVDPALLGRVLGRGN
ncbi:MAG: threonine ammonia-lyase [Sciscionella sp.]